MAKDQQGPRPDPRYIELSETHNRSQDSFDPAPPIAVDTPVSMSLDPAPAGESNNDSPVQATPPTNYDG
jgi:hypothetical protein